MVNSCCCTKRFFGWSHWNGRPTVSLLGCQTRLEYTTPAKFPMAVVSTNCSIPRLDHVADGSRTTIWNSHFTFTVLGDNNSSRRFVGCTVGQQVRESIVAKYFKILDVWVSLFGCNSSNMRRLDLWRLIPTAERNNRQLSD